MHPIYIYITTATRLIDELLSILRRYLLFIAGGVSYAETRAAYEQMQAAQKEVIVGATHITNPSQYLVDVGNLHTSNTKREVMI